MISIYALCDPNDHTVRYIGKSASPTSRYKQHILESLERQNTQKKQWIKKLHDAGQRPDLLILFRTPDEPAARLAESRACHQYISTIYNIHDPRKGAKDLQKNKATK
jgi:hypothetical protein